MKYSYISWVLCILLVLSTTGYSATNTKQGSKDWAYYNELGTKSYDKEEFKQAIKQFEKAFKLMANDKNAKVRYNDISAVTVNLAASYRAIGQYDQADGFYKESLNFSKEFAGKDSDHFATIANNYAIFLLDRAKYDESLGFASDALTIREKLHGKSHPYAAESHRTLAEIQLEKANHDKALKSAQKALLILQSQKQQDELAVAKTEATLGDIYREMNNIEKSLEHTSRALELFEKNLPETHSSIAHAMNNMGLLFNAKGLSDLKAKRNDDAYANFDTAHTLYMKAIPIYASAYGEGHFYFATVLGNIADNLSDASEYDMAVEYHLAAYDRLKTALGDKHPKVAIRLNNYANTAFHKGDYMTSYEAVSKAIDILSPNLGEKHPTTIQVVESCKELLTIMKDKKYSCKAHG